MLVYLRVFKFIFLIYFYFTNISQNYNISAYGNEALGFDKTLSFVKMSLTNTVFTNNFQVTNFQHLNISLIFHSTDIWFCRFVGIVIVVLFSCSLCLLLILEKRIAQSSHSQDMSQVVSQTRRRAVRGNTPSTRHKPRNASAARQLPQ